MFENLLGQDTVKRGLIRDIGLSVVPPAMIFSGPPASGKLTAALETARVMSCDLQGAWNCSCPHCARHRTLSHGDLLLFGRRSIPEEIPVARDLLTRAPTQGSAYFFIRSARKLLARFNPVLWTGDEAKLSKALPLIQSIEESMDGIDPERIASTLDSSTAKLADSVLADCLALETFVPDQPSITAIRNMEVWAQLSPLSRRKTVIIENADGMQDSARNAMLKILEEPPETVRFILLTCRRASMMATILSRSRIYAFAARGAGESNLVASRVFKEKEPVASLQDFFESKTGFPPGKARIEAERFVGILLRERQEAGVPCPSGPLAGRLIQSQTDADISLKGFLEQLSTGTGGFGIKDKKMGGSFQRFLRAILGVLRDMLPESAGDPATLALADRWTRLVRTAAVQYQSLNRSPELLVEVLATAFGDFE